MCGFKREKQIKQHDVQSFVVRTEVCGKNGYEGWDKSHSLWTNWNKVGHDVDNYFLLVGFPQCWVENPRGRGKSTGRGRGTSTTSIIVGRERGGNVKAHGAASSNNYGFEKGGSLSLYAE